MALSLDLLSVTHSPLHTCMGAFLIKCGLEGFTAAIKKMLNRMLLLIIAKLTFHVEKWGKCIFSPQALPYTQGMCCGGRGDQ